VGVLVLVLVLEAMVLEAMALVQALVCRHYLSRLRGNRRHK
jgi:hypothetical protein